MVPDVGGSNPLVRPKIHKIDIPYCLLIKFNIKAKNNGPVVELVDTLDLGSSAVRCEGSSPFRPTKGLIVNEY